MQGAGSNGVSSGDKVKGFCRNHQSWPSRVRRDDHSPFKLLSDFATTETVSAADKETVVTHGLWPFLGKCNFLASLMKVLMLK